MTRSSKRPGSPQGRHAAEAPPRGRAATGEPNRRKTEDASPQAFRRVSHDLVALYGFHAVREALRAGKRKLLAIHATKAAAEKLSAEIAAAGLSPRIVETEELSRRLAPGAVHQGVLLEARPLESLDISEIATRSGIVLALDQITDPHNVGAILRTAAAFGVDAVVTTERHAPDMSGVLAKAASGGLEHVPIVSIVNLSRALHELRQLGYLCVGLDSAGEAPLDRAPLARPLVLVLGGEGKGLRRLTRENCDLMARLDMPGPVKSLNVSNACAVALALVSSRLAG